MTANGAITYSSLQPNGDSWSLLRARFDPWFVGQAEDEGVQCITGATVEALYRENGRVCGVDPLNRALKPTIGLSSSYWAAPLNNFAKKHLESIFSMRDIRRTFKTLSGMLHFNENEKDIVNQHANKSIGKKHYDRNDYIVEKRETTLKWEKAIQILLTKYGLMEINLIIEKEREL
ncbi:site-specific integrase [Citrobacter portucalensis]|uniref:hypothetical protein n=1 Tax=Citrobacter portucalensis TaxID=1639133 RepID=UPI0039089EF9